MIIRSLLQDTVLWEGQGGHCKKGLTRGRRRWWYIYCINRWEQTPGSKVDCFAWAASKATRTENKQKKLVPKPSSPVITLKKTITRYSGYIQEMEGSFKIKMNLLVNGRFMCSWKGNFMSSCKNQTARIRRTATLKKRENKTTRQKWGGGFEPQEWLKRTHVQGT
jgi:hypothetical protein